MKNISLTIAVVALLASCSTENLAVSHGDTNMQDIYEQRMEQLRSIDFTTLFAYSNTNEAKHNLPIAFSKMIENARHRISINKGCTEAIVKVVLEDGKGKLWAQHLLDLPGKKMVESISKKQQSPHLYMEDKEKYTSLYNSVTDALQNKYQSLGNYSEPVTNAALNNYLDKKIKALHGKAEFNIRVTNDVVEIYVLK